MGTLALLRRRAHYCVWFVLNRLREFPRTYRPHFHCRYWVAAPVVRQLAFSGSSPFLKQQSTIIGRASSFFFPSSSVYKTIVHGQMTVLAHASMRVASIITRNLLTHICMGYQPSRYEVGVVSLILTSMYIVDI